MIRKPRSENTPPAEEAVVKATSNDETMAGSKRKLSVSTTLQDDSKRTKTGAAESDTTVNKASVKRDEHTENEYDELKKDEDEDAETADGDDPEVDEEFEDFVGGINFKPKKPAPDSVHYQIDGLGPHTFYLWADAILGVIGQGPVDLGPLYVVLKKAALDAFRKTKGGKTSDSSGSGEDDDDDEGDDGEDEDEALEIVRPFAIASVKGATKTPGGIALVEVWEKISSAERESGADAWWYEVTLQRKRPEEKQPGLQVKLEDSGVWWLADIKPSDAEGNRAMTKIVDFTAHAYD